MHIQITSKLRLEKLRRDRRVRTPSHRIAALDQKNGIPAAIGKYGRPTPKVLRMRLHVAIGRDAVNNIMAGILRFSPVQGTQIGKELLLIHREMSLKSVPNLPISLNLMQQIANRPNTMV